MNMKTKYLIFTLLLLLGAGAATTSCEDMFTAENSLVETDFTPKDSIFQLMGIVRNMQKVVDKSIIIGEVRADLVDINDHTTQALQQLSDNLVSEDNEYNDPTDFYAVVNSCNLYLAYVDSLQKNKGVQKYRNEIIAVKSFRAWAYLELAKIYGEVPFLLRPIVTSSEGEEAILDKANRKSLEEICDVLISDPIEGLDQYKYLDLNNELMPNWNADRRIRNAFIPFRLMLAELYLYRGTFRHSAEDCKQAAILYHDFLTFRYEERPLGMSRDEWNQPSTRPTRSYSNNFRYVPASELVSIPMDTVSYYGLTTDIRSVFNSQYSNNYYANVNPSKRMRERSQEQLCYEYVYNSATDFYTELKSRDINDYADIDGKEENMGDLRYLSNCNTLGGLADESHAEYSATRQWITKYTDGSTSLLGNRSDVRTNYVRLYRLSTVYLHMAEALNYAGFPETAFAVLKYGISESVLKDRTKVSQEEYDRLEQITSYYNGASNLADWDEEEFHTKDQYPNNSTSGTGTTNVLNQWGIHALGCGDVWADEWCPDEKYVLPTDMSGYTPEEYPEYVVDETWTEEELEAYNEQYLAECQAVDERNEEALAAYLATDEIRNGRIEALAKMILDEEALENCYEGTRFYDLMRYSRYWFGDYSYVVEAVSHRKGSDQTNLVGTLTASNVFLPLRSR